MKKREIESYLKQGYTYVDIGKELGIQTCKVTAFVKEHLPELARPHGCAACIVVGPALLKRIQRDGLAVVAKQEGVSVSSIHRAKNRYEQGY